MIPRKSDDVLLTLKSLSFLLMMERELPIQKCFNQSLYLMKWFEEFQSLKSFKGCRTGRSDKVSLWYVALLINTRFRCFILE